MLHSCAYVRDDCIAGMSRHFREIVMSRTTDNSLIARLDQRMRQRAEGIVDDALAPVLHQASAPIIKALRNTAAGGSAATMAAVELHIAEAITAISRDAKDRAYDALTARAIEHLSTGQDFLLN